jgi:hypothetical protein
MMNFNHSNLKYRTFSRYKASFASIFYLLMLNVFHLNKFKNYLLFSKRVIRVKLYIENLVN